jgi:hypothetical protein
LTKKHSGCGAPVACLLWEQEVQGSIPCIPTRLNEIFEYAGDILIFNTISSSSDAAKDLVVNSAGGFFGFGIINLIKKIFSKV